MRLSEAVDIQALMEAPLPPDWEADIFDPRVPFETRVEYAKSKAKRLGAGSSRVVFQIPYQGRETALKVAKNRKGMAQNQAEAAMLDNQPLQRHGILIPLIDFDERGPEPTWIHTEMARKARRADFSAAIGVDSPNKLVVYAMHVLGIRPSAYQHYAGLDLESNTVNRFMAFLSDIGASTFSEVIDYAHPPNWGEYQGRLVIIDAGLSESVYNDFYVRR